MGNDTFRFEVPEKGVVINLYKGDGGDWIIGREVDGQWRIVCKAELFANAKLVFDAEVARIENEVRYWVESL